MNVERFACRDAIDRSDDDGGVKAFFLNRLFNSVKWVNNNHLVSLQTSDPLFVIEVISRVLFLSFFLSFLSFLLVRH